MIIGIVKEVLFAEDRVAVTPAICQKLCTENSVFIEQDAGVNAGFDNAQYQQSGAKVLLNSQDVFEAADVILKIWATTAKEQKLLKNGSTIVADFSFQTDFSFYFSHHISCFALEKMPRTSAAQSMDILSSQSSIAGYKAVILSAEKAKSVIPLMMTSAGTIPALKFLILGLGVAGLQACATAKRLGGIVYASDIRAETAEQAFSVGAKFIKPTDVDSALLTADIIICAATSNTTAPPILINTEKLQTLKKTAIVIDLANGNVQGERNDLCLIRNNNLASTIPHTASTLFANNLYNFLSLQFDFNQPAVTAIYIGEK